MFIWVASDNETGDIVQCFFDTGNRKLSDILPISMEDIPDNISYGEISVVDVVNALSSSNIERFPNDTITNFNNLYLWDAQRIREELKVFYPNEETCSIIVRDNRAVIDDYGNINE